MTTIAYRDGVLAADSLMTWTSEAGGGTKYPTVKLYRRTIKKGRKREEALFGFAGNVAVELMFLEWIEKGGDVPEELAEKRTELDIICVKDSGAVLMDGVGAVMETDMPFLAIGSGRNAALGAMYAGRGAIAAVKIACKIDPGSSGPVRSLKLR